MKISWQKVKHQIIMNSVVIFIGLVLFWTCSQIMGI